MADVLAIVITLVSHLIVSKVGRCCCLVLLYVADVIAIVTDGITT